MARLNDTTINGNLTVSGKVAAASFNATSDRRLKTNVKPYDTCNSVLGLNVYEYDLIATGEHSIGCMADELMKVCPDIVSSGDDGYLTIQETKLAYLLLLEVKKLREELTEMREHLGR